MALQFCIPHPVCIYLVCPDLSPKPQIVHGLKVLPEMVKKSLKWQKSAKLAKQGFSFVGSNDPGSNDMGTLRVGGG